MNIADLWTLRIEHDYYWQNETQEIDVRLSSEMRILLMRRNLLWRRKSVSEWCLSSFGDYSLNDEDTLELEILTAGSSIHYVTDLEWPVGRECYEVSVPLGDGILVAKECIGKRVRTKTSFGFMKLLVPVGQMVNRKIPPSATTLAFRSVPKYWEYVLLPRRPETEKSIRLEDVRKSISFAECEAVDFLGHRACKVRSLSKLPLRERYQDIDLVAWEKFFLRDIPKERLLLRSIPFPEPTLNLGTARDTVWRILYY